MERDDKSRRSYRDVGGTPGGMSEFVIGAALLALGGYLFVDRITVHSGFASFMGVNSFGLALIPIFAGITVLFVSGKSIIGWGLTVLGAVAILGGVLSDLRVYFRPTSLFATLTMIALMAAGLGFIIRAVRAHNTPASDSNLD